jgi:hypothetical protein
VLGGSTVGLAAAVASSSLAAALATGVVLGGREGPYGAVGHCQRLYKKQQRNEGVTEIMRIPNRGHALTIDSGWREVADTALGFVKRFG